MPVTMERLGYVFPRRDRAPVASSAHAYFETIRQRGDAVQAYSFRPADVGTGHDTPNTDPYYSKQLLRPNLGGFLVANTNYHPPTFDTVIDGAKWQSLHYGGDADGVGDTAPTRNLASDMDTSTLTVNLDGAAPAVIYNVNKTIWIDGEVMEIETKSGSTLTVKARGKFGTPITTHTAGTEVKYSMISIAGNDQWRATLPAPMVDGDRYCWTWAFRFDSNWLDVGLTGQKTWQIAETGDVQWWETQTRHEGGAPPAPGWDPATMVAHIGARQYSDVPDDPVEPFANRRHIPPDEWCRVWVEVLMHVGSDALVSMWFSAESDTGAPTLIYDAVPVNTASEANLSRFWVELNFSLETTSQKAADKGWPPMYSWHRNLVLLKPTSIAYRDDVIVRGGY